MINDKINLTTNCSSRNALSSPPLCLLGVIRISNELYFLANDNYETAMEVLRNGFGDSFLVFDVGVVRRKQKHQLFEGVLKEFPCSTSIDNILNIAKVGSN